ncbi:hypothetical protein DL89DRAFT_319772 [Linderina pennispora]|uniref:Ubiquitin 3 binding protein But2 C-terminal domain-containing protein n=1 Tax=Linderina pennispora TaxID=61395 RepID=A0A1Y1WKS9_9FUNG|nr:uncharacterized protein DL89DRAFT_319772 [Linderina pennispora]ORX74169.1 hypothetical protein DL89DRAFT_319772 [Linderina pennispora]
MKFFATAAAFLATAAMTVSAIPLIHASYRFAPTKDASLGLSQKNYNTTLGTEKTIYSSNKPDDVHQILLGFTMPDEALTMPFFEIPQSAPATIWAIRGEGEWDQATVTGAHQPAKVGLDVTYMCVDAAQKGADISIFVASLDSPYTGTSIEGGRPATLEVGVLFQHN